jgi:hypothetical protein
VTWNVEEYHYYDKGKGQQEPVHLDEYEASDGNQIRITYDSVMILRDDIASSGLMCDSTILDTVNMLFKGMVLTAF